MSGLGSKALAKVVDVAALALYGCAGAFDKIGDWVTHYHRDSGRYRF